MRPEPPANMTLPPESELRACLEVLRRAILNARSWAWKKKVDPAQLADLMDAIHNIPDMLQRWESCDRELMLEMLSDYETKWSGRGQGGPSLLDAYACILQDNDN